MPLSTWKNVTFRMKREKNRCFSNDQFRMMIVGKRIGFSAIVFIFQSCYLLNCNEYFLWFVKIGMTSFPISPEFKLNGELSSQVGKRELFFLKKMVILKDLFVFLTASGHNLPNYWTLKNGTSESWFTSDIHLLCGMRISNQVSNMWEISQKFMHRQSIIMLKHRE